MGKVEQDGKIEQFKAAMNNRDYDTAVQIADTLDIKHIRDNNMLSLIADAYELSNDYELAKQVLLYLNRYQSSLVVLVLHMECVQAVSP